eukprot:m.239325 g.239325  ORF g.239325 m.239325 type:complete len:331 (+) comp13463_c0_seq1:569-1561(+)
MIRTFEDLFVIFNDQCRPLLARAQPKPVSGHIMSISAAFFSIFFLLVPIVHVWRYPCWLLPSQRHDLKYIMVRVNELLNTYEVPHVMADGSLLGLVREHGIIPWDSDVDVSIPISAQGRFDEVIQTPAFRADFLTEEHPRWRCQKLYHAKRFGQSDFMRLFYKRIYIDVCTLRPTRERDLYPLFFPENADGSFNLTTITDQYGFSFPAPNPPERLLEAMYGPDYMHPHLADDGGDGFNSFMESCPVFSRFLEKLMLVLAVITLILQFSFTDSMSLQVLLSQRRKKGLSIIEYGIVIVTALAYVCCLVLGLFVLSVLIMELSYTTLNPVPL